MGTSHLLTLDQVESWQGPPLILFVGVDTGGSLVHQVFGRWAGLLGQPWALRGVDLPADSPPEAYRRLVSAMRDGSAVRGAVVTAHKLRLYRACASRLSPRNLLTDLTHEVNALTAGPSGYARDALSLTYVLPGLAHPSGAHWLCMGAGGAATALLLALHLDVASDLGPRGDLPGHVTFADVNPRALHDLRTVADRAGIDPGGLSFVHVRDPDACDRMVAGLPAPGIVVNATGLGKTHPGSPVTSRAPFGDGILAWDLNYRGPLTFLRQAAARGAPTADGWDYFVAGWAGALTAIAGVPFTAELLTRFGQAAAPFRPRTHT